MTAQEILSSLQARGVQISTDGEKLHFLAPAEEDELEITKLLMPHKSEIILFLTYGSYSVEEWEALAHTPAQIMMSAAAATYRGTQEVTNDARTAWRLGSYSLVPFADMIDAAQAGEVGEAMGRSIIQTWQKVRALLEATRDCRRSRQQETQLVNNMQTLTALQLKLSCDCG